MMMDNFLKNYDDLIIEKRIVSMQNETVKANSHLELTKNSQKVYVGLPTHTGVRSGKTQKSLSLGIRGFS